MSACRSCGAEMRWVKTINGKAMPLDPEPVPNGNIQLDDDGQATVLAGKNLEAVRATGAQLYLSHHVSCPQGSEWRR